VLRKESFFGWVLRLLRFLLLLLLLLLLLHLEWKGSS
jgi:hypothetical protein